jgi:hypothetical protein
MNDSTRRRNFVPFDGAEKSIHIYTYQLIGLAKPYNFMDSHFGTITVHQAWRALDPEQDTHNKPVYRYPEYVVRSN